MPILICTGCQTRLAVPNESIARRVRCPRCPTILVVPLPISPASEPASSPHAVPRTSPDGKDQPSVILSAPNRVQISGTIIDSDVHAIFACHKEALGEFAMRVIKVGALALRDAGTVSRLVDVDDAFKQFKLELDKRLHEFLGTDGKLQAAFDREFKSDGGRVTEILSPSTSKPIGDLLIRLGQQLDCNREDSPLSALKKQILDEFAKVRDGFAERKGRVEADMVGTRKGRKFEEFVYNAVRNTANQALDDISDPLGDKFGTIGKKVGDFYCTLNDRETHPRQLRVVVEVKKTKISLTGNGSIITELDEAMLNRDAQFAIVAVVRECADFGVLKYKAPKYVLVSVDDDVNSEQMPLQLAYSLARAFLIASASHHDGRLSVGKLEAIIKMIESPLDNVQSMLGQLTKANNMVEEVHKSLKKMEKDIKAKVKNLIEVMHDESGTASLP